MEEIEKTLKSEKCTEETMIRILLNSHDRSILKEIMPLLRRYTDTIIINYQEGLTNSMISIGKKTISLR